MNDVRTSLQDVDDTLYVLEFSKSTKTLESAVV